MPLRDYVSFNSDFRDSVNLYLDLNKTEKIKSYIPTKSSVDILDQYLSSVIDNRQKSTLLIGPYGKGKSHLLLLLLATLSMKHSNQNDTIVNELVKKVSKVNSETSKKINEAYRRGRFLPILIMSTQGDLNQAFLVGLNEALKREKLTELTPETYYTYAVGTIQRWKNEYPDTYVKFQSLLKERKLATTDMVSSLKNCDSEALEIFRCIYPKLTSGSVFNPLVSSEVLPMYKNIADKLVEEYEYSGIYIVFDEFSKYIEGQDKQSTGNNMKLLQDICELANASKKSQVFLTMVAHKSIKEYGKYLSAETINSFTGIEGRIKEILFVTSLKNNYELIQNAINKREGCFKEPNIQEHVTEEVVDSYYQMAAFTSEFMKKDFEEIVVKGCYPLSPTSAYLLLNISEKVAQNERTLFTFISKDEQYSMAKAVNGLQENARWIISAELIYDYFKGLFKKDVTNEFVHNEWLNAEYALGKVSEFNQRKMLKTLAIINIVNKPDELPSDFNSLKLASGVPDPGITLQELCLKGLIYKKGSNNCYVFKTRATSELKTEIKKRVNVKGTRTNINKMLSMVSDTHYILPKRYNNEFSMTRYFRYEYMNVKEFLNINRLDVMLDDDSFCDGKIIALYSFDDIDYSAQIEQKISQNNCGRLIVLYNNIRLELESQIQEFEVIQELKEDKAFFELEENQVLKKEIPIIEDDLNREIYAFIEHSFEEDSDKKVYYCIHDELICESKVRLSDVTDRICYQVYSQTLAVNNELINKENITSVPIKKARRVIIEKLITGTPTEEYMRGTSAEATIYRALFVGTGIKNENYQRNAEAVLQIFNEFINSACNNKRSVSELVNQLVAAPIGMRKGIIPIYLSYTLSLRNEDIVVYFDKKEVSLSTDIILNMCESPDDYSIFISLEDVMKEQYIENLCFLFGVKDTTNKSESRLQNILLSMQRWFRALPQVTKNIKRQNEYFENDVIGKAFPKIKNMLQSVEANPYEVLLVDMPIAFETGTDFEKLAELLVNLKDKLNGYYDWITQKAVEKTIQVFDKKAKQDLHHTLLEWYECQSNLAKYGLHSSAITGLMNCIVENKSFDNAELVKKIVRAVTNMYLDSWNDNTLEVYLETLNTVKDQIELLDDKNRNTGNLELSFVAKSGESIVRYYEHVDEGTGVILKNILSDTLEDFSDLSVNDKVAILLEMIEKELG